MSVAEPHRKLRDNRLLSNSFSSQMHPRWVAQVTRPSLMPFLLGSCSELLSLTRRPPGDHPGEFRVGRTACLLNSAPPTVAQECWHANWEAKHKTLHFEFFFANTVTLASPQDSEMGLIM